MNNGILVGSTVLLLALNPAFGADEPRDDGGDLYRARETTLDLFGSGSVGQRTLDNITNVRLRHDVRLGAGAGINHFVTRHFGLGVEAYSESIAHSFVDNASLSLIGRMPIGRSGFAPYAFGGGGHQFDPIALNYLHAGAGVEYRFTRRLGLFLDGRYVFTDETQNYGMARLGLRLGF